MMMMMASRQKKRDKVCKRARIVMKGGGVYTVR
jgi:hypothetical protein